MNHDIYNKCMRAPQTVLIATPTEVSLALIASKNEKKGGITITHRIHVWYIYLPLVDLLWHMYPS